MITEAKRLFDLGFAIHWIRPKSKAPVESKWTTGERKPWGYLASSYKTDYNVGVRLGRPSRFKDGTYLAVIDCDMKSGDARHLKEMEAKLSELITRVGAVVVSGRGQGSRHIYIRTKEPLKPARYSASNETVRVHMPSSSPSKKELAALTPKEIASGARLRTAWEISLMGDGQQVVLPPSVHPDTGGLYAWGRVVNGPQSIPLFTPKESLGEVATKEGVVETLEDFAVVDVLPLELYGLSADMIGMIEDGAGVSDRSATLFIACIAMMEARMSQAEILTVLTDRANYLGEVAYDHAKTNSRAKAANWLYRFTYQKAARETLASEQFKSEVETITLTDEAAAVQEAELFGERDWRDQLDRVLNGQESRLKTSLKNVILILRNAVAPNVFRHDGFGGRDVYGVAPPWNNAKAGDDIRDVDIVNITTWLVNNYGIEVAEKKIFQAIIEIASANHFHPVRDFLLNDLPEWDGVARADHWLRDYLGATAPEPYLSAVSRKVLVAMVARVMQPGIKFDHVLILEGLQGTRKSTVLRALAGSWFSDASLTIGDKDSVLLLNSVWVKELSEITSVHRADVNQLKEFISRQEDRIRAPYGRFVERFPRQCIFIGTTNLDEYLKDMTGNRRFWPVKVGDCEPERLEADQGQLLAEALFLYQIGEPLYLDDVEAAAQSTGEQETRAMSDVWSERFLEFEAEQALKPEGERFNFDRFSLLSLFQGFGPFADSKDGIFEQRRAADALRRCGYESRYQDGRKRWRKKEGDTRLKPAPLKESGARPKPAWLKRWREEKKGE